MKALILLLIIYINYAICAEVKYSVKQYPKKVKPGHLRIIESGKYEKIKPTKYTKKQDEKNKAYTVFPDVVKPVPNFPDNPVFDPDIDLSQKPRVKKVLPDYTWTLRHKRSAPLDDPKPAEAKKEDPKFEPKEPSKAESTVSVAVQSEATTKASSSAATTKAKKNIARANSKRSSGQKKKPKPKKLKAKKPKPIKRNRKNSAKSKPKSKVGPQRSSGKTNQKQNKPKVSRRLIAARDAMIEDYPYVVSIQKDDQHWCAGALLNPRLVITTANCMWKASRISRMEVRAGSRHVNHGGQVAGIAEVMKHPGWGIRKNPDFDLALVLLDRNFLFSDSLHAVDIPNHAMLPAFDDAWITSWGAERRDGVYDPKPDTLQVYHARLMDRSKCNNVTQRFGVTVTENFICLAQTGRRAPCTRDTGAPAVSDGIIWGLASWGIRKLCGTERFPAMFSYLASPYNMDFIINATQYLMSDQRHNPFLDRIPNVYIPRTTTATPLPV